MMITSPDQITVGMVLYDTTKARMIKGIRALTVVTGPTRYEETPDSLEILALKESLWIECTTPEGRQKWFSITDRGVGEIYNNNRFFTDYDEALSYLSR